MIQLSGMVPTRAEMVSRHPLQEMPKSQRRFGGIPNTNPSIGEYKAKTQVGKSTCTKAGATAGQHKSMSTLPRIPPRIPPRSTAERVEVEVSENLGRFRKTTNPNVRKP